MLESLLAYSELKLGPTWGPAAYELVTSLVFIVAIVVPLMLSVAYLTLWEPSVRTASARSACCSRSPMA